MHFGPLLGTLYAAPPPTPQEMLTLSLEAMQEYEKKGLRQLLAGVNEQVGRGWGQEGGG